MAVFTQAKDADAALQTINQMVRAVRRETVDMAQFSNSYIEYMKAHPFTQLMVDHYPETFGVFGTVHGRVNNHEWATSRISYSIEQHPFYRKKFLGIF